MRDPGGWGAWSARLLVLQALICGLAVGIALLHGPGFAEPDANVGYLFVAVLQSIVFIVAGIVVLRWIYVVTGNAHAFGAQGLSTGPRMAVGAYFIPIVNLVLPFQSLRDVWKASVEPRDWEIVRAPAMLGWWWFFWLTGNIAGIVAFRLADRERYPDASRVAETLIVVSDGLTIGASLFLAVIARRLTGIQRGRMNLV